MEEFNNEIMNDESYTPVNKLEVVKATWKQYPPTTVLGMASIGCLIGANKAHVRRQAALYSAYMLAETARTECKEKVD